MPHAEECLKYGHSSQKPLLSISILVSGREETTQKCIASLEKLRRRVPCELILTDTGCPEEMREWLKQKADKLLKFTWCDDFAAARSVGLQASSGQWFLFLDDDEWFEDTARIEEFFLSGEYRNYQSATYLVRNYTDMEGTAWLDTPQSRMTRRRPDTRFFYPVHESLWPLLDPMKHLEDYAHHYGYASADPEVRKAKNRRNLDILLPAIEGDPHCMKHYLQAVSEYYSLDDCESACRMADLGIENCDPSREENTVHIDGLYAAAVRMRLRGKKDRDVIRMGKDFLEKAALSDLAKASIQGDLAIAYGELGEYGECLDHLQIYLGWKDYFAQHREAWLKQETVVLNACFENFQYRKVMGWGFAAALSLGDAETAEGLLAGESLTWWLDAVRHWYTFAPERGREKWQDDFRQIYSRLAATNHLRDAKSGGLEEGAQRYVRIRQLYEILTAPTDEPEQEMPAGQETAVTAAREMEELAEQLKGKVRLFIEQGQVPAALTVVRQLQEYFPGDAELAQLRKQLDDEG